MVTCLGISCNGDTADVSLLSLQDAVIHVHSLVVFIDPSLRNHSYKGIATLLVQLIQYGSISVL